MRNPTKRFGMSRVVRLVALVATLASLAAAGPAPALAGAVESAFTAGLGVAATVGAVVFVCALAFYVVSRARPAAG